MSDTYQTTGTIKIIGDTQTFGSGFTKREVIVTVGDGDYPQDLKFEMVKDKCKDLDKFSVGDEVTAHFNINGNEYNGKYYVNLQAWRLEAAGSEGTGKAQAADPVPDSNDEFEDDIPF